MGTASAVVLWLPIGVVYLEGDWRPVEKRMHFVRFSGEWSIYFVLIGLGGGVLIGLTVATFDVLGIDASPSSSTGSCPAAPPGQWW